MIFSCKKIVVAILMAMLLLQAHAQVDQKGACGPVPTENQLQWQDMEMYAFIHYSLNTYTDQDAEQNITTFRYLPPQDTQDGIVTHCTLLGSNDWSNWDELASGEFSNIVNNPIWQTIKFNPTKVRVLRFEADRLSNGSRMGYGDILIK